MIGREPISHIGPRREALTVLVDLRRLPDVLAEVEAVADFFSLLFTAERISAPHKARVIPYGTYWYAGSWSWAHPEEGRRLFAWAVAVHLSPQVLDLSLEDWGCYPPTGVSRRAAVEGDCSHVVVGSYWPLNYPYILLQRTLGRRQRQSEEIAWRKGS